MSSSATRRCSTRDPGTQDELSSGSAFVVSFGTACKGGGEGLRTVYLSLMTRGLLRWCVRGGQGPHIIR